MNIDMVKKIIQLAQESKVSSLEVESGDLKVKVALASTGDLLWPTPAAIQKPLPEATSHEVNAGEKKISGKEVKSPFVGTFYNSPNPGKPPYVKVGDRVKKGQVLCIIEAMKIMNEIESDHDGVVVDICKDNEAIAEYGEVLFRIQ
jgi:acetyl-CoA carboxylase biotin carboxyl carrier protein